MDEDHLKNSCDVKYMNDKFIIKSFSCESQYNQYYKSRRLLMKNKIEKSVMKTWTNDVKIVRLKDITNKCYDLNDKIVIIGILIKQMEFQPSILKEMIQPSQIEPISFIRNYTSNTDKLYLQDGDEIIQITGNIEASLHVTGVCIGLIGQILEGKNIFKAEGVCYPFIDNKPGLPFIVSRKDHSIAFISGLGFSKNMETNNALIKGLNLFINYIRGDISYNYIGTNRVTRVIIAGNCLGLNAQKQEYECKNEQNSQKWNRSYMSNTFNAFNKFDKFVYKLAQLVDVDIMPGELDPSTQLLPQQPFHPSIFKKSNLLTSIKCVTNPHCAIYEGRNFLGSSGQNIKSLLQYSKLPDALEAMRRTLEWSHIAPTCPDTLFSYPYKDTDPFVITQYPDVYFTGNQQEYNCGTFVAPNGEKVVLVAVPVFETKMSCVLINLNSLMPEILLFS